MWPARCVHRLDGGPTSSASEAGGQQQPFSDPAVGGGGALGFPRVGLGVAAAAAGLADPLGPAGGVGGELRGGGAFPRHMLSRRQLGGSGGDPGTEPPGPSGGAGAGQAPLPPSVGAELSPGVVRVKITVRFIHSLRLNVGELVDWIVRPAEHILALVGEREALGAGLAQRNKNRAQREQK